MDVQQIEQVIELAEQWALAELEVEMPELRVKVVRLHPKPSGRGDLAATANPVSASAEPAVSKDRSIPDQMHVIRSQMVGQFTMPPAESGLSVPMAGDRVSAGQVLGYIEAMKMQSEVVCDCDGELVEWMVDDQQGVEFNDPLVLIRPDNHHTEEK